MTPLDLADKADHTECMAALRDAVDKKEQEKQKQKQLKKSEQRLSGAKTRSQMKRENKKKEQLQKIQDKVLLGQVATDASFLREFLDPTVEIQAMSVEQVVP